MIPFAGYVITKTETLNTCCLKNILRENYIASIHCLNYHKDHIHMDCDVLNFTIVFTIMIKLGLSN